MKTENMRNKMIGSVVVVVVLIAIAFYGGMKYGQSSSASARGNFARSGANGAFGSGAAGMRGGAGLSAVNGSIIAKDDTSITVQLRNGGSQIIFYSPSTTVGKFTTGSSSDLSVGDTVMVSGTTGSDGSVTAQSIQIRPTAPATPTAPAQ